MTAAALQRSGSIFFPLISIIVTRIFIITIDEITIILPANKVIAGDASLQDHAMSAACSTYCNTYGR
jgi:hypothetical protein